MEHLKLDIIRRKRLDRSAFIYALIAFILLTGGIFQYLTLGKVPFIEELARQLGLLEWLRLISVSFYIVTSIVIIRGLTTLFRKKRELSGTLTFSQEQLEIKKGKQSFQLTGLELQEIQFDLNPPKNQQAPLSGGNWVRIPSPKGTYRCEFDMCDDQTFNALKSYLNHFEKVHQVRINLNESEKTSS